jgi:hypothetical protein
MYIVKAGYPAIFGSHSAECKRKVHTVRFYNFIFWKTNNKIRVECHVN